MKTLNETDRIAAGLLRLRAKGPVLVALDVSGSSQRDVIRWASSDIAAALVSVGVRSAHFVTFDSRINAVEHNVALELLLDVALDRLMSAREMGGTDFLPVVKCGRELGVQTIIAFTDCMFSPVPLEKGDLERIKVLFVQYPAGSGPQPEFGLTIPYMR